MARTLGPTTIATGKTPDLHRIGHFVQAGSQRGQVVLVVKIVGRQVGNQGGLSQPQRPIQSRAKALITCQAMIMDARVGQVGLNNRLGLIRGGVINDDQLPISQSLTAQAVKRPPDKGGVFVGRHKNRY